MVAHRHRLPSRLRDAFRIRSGTDGTSATRVACSRFTGVFIPSDFAIGCDLASPEFLRLRRLGLTGLDAWWCFA